MVAVEPLSLPTGAPGIRIAYERIDAAQALARSGTLAVIAFGAAATPAGDPRRLDVPLQVLHGPADVLARMNGGQPTDPSEYYFRTAIRFETGAPELAWMNRIIAVGVGQRPPSGPTYDVYAIA